MKTAINGKVRPRLFWRSTYSNNKMKPIQILCRIGNLILAKVVYPYPCIRGCCDPDYHREEAMALVEKYFKVVWEPFNDGDDDWQVVYSKVDGGYVGTPEDAYRFIQRGLVDIQKADPEDKVCSIGYNPKETKWYGWSHRAMYGFGIGSVVQEGDCCASSGWTEEYLKEHPEENTALPVGFKAYSMGDAMKMAIAFAKSVG